MRGPQRGFEDFPVMASELLPTRKMNGPELPAGR